MMITSEGASKATKVLPPAPVKKQAGHGGGTDQPKLNSVGHQRFVQASSDYFTPEAIRQIYNIQVQRVPETQTGGDAEYAPTLNVIRTNPQFLGANFDPVRTADTMRHEYNHAFDFLNGSLSQTPQFYEDAMQAGMSNFPGMGSTPRLGNGWGGPIEAYAQGGVNAYDFPTLRKYYPQYTDKAYIIPPSPTGYTKDYDEMINNRNTYFRPRITNL